MDVSSFIKSVYYLIQIRKLSLEDGFKRICYRIYYHDIPFQNFKEFESYNLEISNMLKPYDQEVIKSYRK